ncbi:hypothetical protein BDZ45DRAFT_697637 [Acephala macrosclerotiorum]|nr:hypothetical protein BDZ45DRAFT_697637 [Acephala macrosclerotiorum]
MVGASPLGPSSGGWSTVRRKGLVPLNRNWSVKPQEAQDRILLSPREISVAFEQNDKIWEVARRGAPPAIQKLTTSSEGLVPLNPKLGNWTVKPQEAQDRIPLSLRETSVAGPPWSRQGLAPILKKTSRLHQGSGLGGWPTLDGVMVEGGMFSLSLSLRRGAAAGPLLDRGHRAPSFPSHLRVPPHSSTLFLSPPVPPIQLWQRSPLTHPPSAEIKQQSTMASTNNQPGATPGNDQERIFNPLDYFTGGPVMRANRLAAMSPEEVERLRVIRETGRLAAPADASRESGGGVGGGASGASGEGGGGGSADASRESGGGLGAGWRQRPACQCRACKRLRGEEEESAGGRYTLCKIEFR